ncbi:glycosyltransferase [Exiguobacterium sp. s149]|uniref:glycosyltransferase n=1 Tax=Exiguobacterium TaxID=33986 RepID=UPI001BE945ED|nr:glycosyltransferase [Exiguobacterium sp. s149]
MKKKILHLLNSGSFSGAENVALTIIQNTNNEEYISYYASLDGSIREVMKENQVNFVAFQEMNISQITKVINQIEPDVIHAHDFTASIVASLATIKIPIISHIHNNVPWLKKITINSFVFLFSSLRSKTVLGVSPSIINEYVFSKLIKQKFTNVGNPIDRKKIIQKSKSISSVNKAYDLIFIGRLSEQKDPFTFIKIVKEVKEYIPNISVAMVGDGHLKDECMKIINELGLNSNIEMLGFISNPYMVLDESKILCMTSKWEGYGLVAAESLVLGKPVIAHPVGGLPTIVNDSCGLLTKSIPDYIEEVVKLLQNDAYYNEKVNQSLKRSEELDNLQTYMEVITTLYKKYSN